MKYHTYCALCGNDCHREICHVWGAGVHEVCPRCLGVIRDRTANWGSPLLPAAARTNWKPPDPQLTFPI